MPLSPEKCKCEVPSLSVLKHICIINKKAFIRVFVGQVHTAIRLYRKVKAVTQKHSLMNGLLITLVPPCFISIWTQSVYPTHSSLLLVSNCSINIWPMTQTQRRLIATIANLAKDGTFNKLFDNARKLLRSQKCGSGRLRPDNNKKEKVMKWLPIDS